MTPRGPISRLAAGALALGLLGGGLAGSGSACADLRGGRDLDRAIEALGSAGSPRRIEAARWLGAHGPVERVMPVLLESLARESDIDVQVPLALAVARRARAADALRVLALEQTLRSPGRAPLVVALAQLGTDETDAWLVSRLASPGGVELRPAFEQAAEIARQRRDAILARVLEVLADHEAPLLVGWLSSLADERARAALLSISLRVGPARGDALEGLARLGPDEETARLLADPAMVAEMLGASTELAARFVEARLAADPNADVSAFLSNAHRELRAAAVEAMIERAPERAVSGLGAALDALAPADARALDAAIQHPSDALSPWLREALEDASLEPRVRSDALEALVSVPACEASLERIFMGELALAEAALADARLARACPGRARSFHDDDPLVSLHLDAIAGRDVGDQIAMRFGGATRDDRLLLAHAWLSGPAADARIAGALETETDPEVFAVLALAARAHRLPIDTAGLLRRVMEPSTRLAALDLALDADAPPSPALARALEEVLGGSDADAAALALHALARHRPGAVTAFACAALESREPVLERAAGHVLAARSSLPECLQQRARVDPEVRARLAVSSPASSSPTIAAEQAPLVVRVVSNVGAALQQLTIQTLTGRTVRLRPARDGLVVAAGLGPADVRLRLDHEAGDR